MARPLARGLPWRLWWFGLLVPWALEGAAVAAESEPAEANKPRVLLDNVRSVTLQRSTVFDSPRATSAVEPEELRGRPPRSVGDALRDEEATFVQQPSYGTQNANLRGLGDGRVQVLVDGLSLNTIITSTIPGGLTNLSLVDPWTLNGIEVVRGPGLNTYGPGGLGGAIFLRTMHPTPIAGSSIELMGRARGIYTSPDQGFQGSLLGGGRWNRFALETAFSVRRFRDVMGGSQGGPQPLTGYSEGALYVGAGADLGHGTVVVVFQGVRQYDQLRSERSQSGDLYTMPEVARDLAYLRYENNELELGGHAVEVSATTYYQRQSEVVSRQQLIYDSLLHLSNRVDVFGLQGRARTDLGRGGSVTLGLDGSFEWVSSSAGRAVLHSGGSASELPSPAEARYPDGGRGQMVSVFLQDELDVEKLFRGHESDRPGRLRALLGARAGVNFLHIGRDDRLGQLLGSLLMETLPERQLTDPVYGGSLHLRYELHPGLALSLGGMTGVRIPNLDDYSRLDAGRPGLLLPTRSTLRSESAYSGELGVRTAYRHLEGAVFYAFTYLDNPLVTAPLTVGGQLCLGGQDGRSCDRFLSRDNGDPMYMHSVEANLRIYMFWGLSAMASVTYTHAVDAKDPSAGVPIGRIPPVNGVAALEYSRPRAVFSFAQVIVRWAGPQRRLATEDLFDPTICLPALPQGSCNGTPGFAIVSLRSVLRLSRQIYMTGVLDNITNDSYRFHGSGVDGPGLGVHVAVEANY